MLIRQLDTALILDMTKVHCRSGLERLVQGRQLEAEELRKRAQQAVRHRLATETEAPQEKVLPLMSQPNTSLQVLVLSNRPAVLHAHGIVTNPELILLITQCRCQYADLLICHECT